MHLIHNEQVKLHSTWFNTASVGLALGAVLVPYLQFLELGGLGAIPVRLWPVAATTLIGAGLLHAHATHNLQRLREDKPEGREPPGAGQGGVVGGVTAPAGPTPAVELSCTDADK